MTFKAFLARVTSWAALAFVVVAMVVGSACAGSVDSWDSSENVAEAQGALQACGLRGICPTGTACDYTDLLCHPLCPRSGLCDDGNDCTVDTCGKGLCYFTAVTDGLPCSVCSGSASGVCGSGWCRDPDSGLPIGHDC